MTTPAIDPRLISGLASQFATLSEQMRRVSGDLGVLQAQIVAPAPRQPVHQYPAPPSPQAYPQPTYPQSTYPQAQTPQAPPAQVPTPTRASAVRPRPHTPSVPATPTKKSEPWWQRDGVISRVLAVAGAGVTLIGVVMLLVLAAQAGWFGPELRVGAGAVFSIALVYIGSRIYSKSGGRIGGIATAATGVAGLYLDVVAVTVVYEWLEPIIGLIAAFGIAAAGVALAVSWRSQPMAVLILIGVAICAPVVTGGITLSLIAFFTATFIASFAAQLGRDWPILSGARTLPVVVVTLFGIAQAENWGASVSEAIPLLIVSAIVAAFGIGSSVELLRRNVADVMASAMIAASAIPVLVVGALFDPWTATLVHGVVALGCLLVIAVGTWLPASSKIVLALVGSLALLQAVVVPTSVELRPLALLVVAAVLEVAALRTSSKLAYFVGAAFGALGSLGYLIVSPPASIMDSDYAVDEFGVVLAGLLLVAVAAGLVYVGAQLKIAGKNLQAFWVGAGVVSLYALTSATVALGMVAIGGTTGFVAGHCAATIEWMAGAMALLVLGLRSEKYAHTALLAGLSLTAASVAKLFLFDLVALDGLFRVGAFIIVGLLLLFAGTRYAKVFADRAAS
ncbi:DUF2339 domain-containing protein [Rhodococcus sp. EPR-157]|uniref:DUF2339 domain-containing protein n=1 Tax=Rhodococcus sp. EPR-157 TaxID=1813677 RepID=UPI0009EE07DA|nr:DUF2339 domain-containing protein [Rhodococcus sp. EPR-157]